MSDSESVGSNLPPKRRKGESWSCTDMATVDFSHTWTIKNFPLFGEGLGKAMKSPTFSSGVPEDEDRWCLELYPQGESKETQDYVGLYLNLASTKKPKIRAKSEFSILNAQGVPKETFGNDKVDEFGTENDTGFTSWGYSRLIPRDELLDIANGFLINGSLTILCNVTIVNNPVHVSGEYTTNLVVPKCQLSHDLGTLFENPKLTDITIAGSFRKFQAHKGILAARSSVFAAMFEHGMKEKKFSKVEITDATDEVIEEMLRFIYTGKVSNIEEMARDLLFIADKYDLGRLKVMCEAVFDKQLTAENAAETLLLADRHNAKELKKHTLNFIAKHVTKVTETDGWKSMIDLHHRLATEALQALFGKAHKC